MYLPADLRNQMNLIAFLLLASLRALELFPFFAAERVRIYLQAGASVFSYYNSLFKVFYVWAVYEDPCDDFLEIMKFL